MEHFNEEIRNYIEQADPEMKRLINQIVRDEGFLGVYKVMLIERKVKEMFRGLDNETFDMVGLKLEPAELKVMDSIEDWYIEGNDPGGKRIQALIKEHGTYFVHRCFELLCFKKNGQLPEPCSCNDCVKGREQDSNYSAFIKALKGKRIPTLGERLDKEPRIPSFGIARDIRKEITIA